MRSRRRDKSAAVTWRNSQWNSPWKVGPTRRSVAALDGGQGQVFTYPQESTYGYHAYAEHIPGAQPKDEASHTSNEGSNGLVARTHRTEAHAR
jgi:hypothetical protein